MPMGMGKKRSLSLSFLKGPTNRARDEELYEESIIYVHSF
jgi:hypothetical protein